MKKILLLFFLGFCIEKNFYWEESGFTMGTNYSIVVEIPKNSNINPQLIQKEIYSIFEFINNSFSLYIEESKINQINKNQVFKISKKESYLYEIAKNICVQTKGYFFPFKKKVIYYAKLKKVSIIDLCSSFEIEKYENYDLIKKKYDWIRFDLNAIAKGYAVDLIKEFLTSKNLTRYLIEIGGEICLGDPPSSNEKGWRVAIQSPESDVYSTKIDSIKEFKNICLASSGNYLQEHIFNPYEIYGLIKNKKEEKQLVVVFGPSCTFADAFATSFSVKPDIILDENYKIEFIKSLK